MVSILLNKFFYNTSIIGIRKCVPSLYTLLFIPPTIEYITAAFPASTS